MLENAVDVELLWYCYSESDTTRRNCHVDRHFVHASIVEYNIIIIYLNIFQSGLVYAHPSREGKSWYDIKIIHGVRPNRSYKNINPKQFEDAQDVGCS